MALVMYHDEACTQPVTAGAPDEVRQAVQSGQALTETREFWIKSDDALLTYENISITGVGDNNTPATNQIDIKYSLTDGSYQDTLALADGNFEPTAVKIWRQVHCPEVTQAFNVTSITHQITADEYVL